MHNNVREFIPSLPVMKSDIYLKKCWSLQFKPRSLTSKPTNVKEGLKIEIEGCIIGITMMKFRPLMKGAETQGGSVVVLGQYPLPIRIGEGTE